MKEFIFSKEFLLKSWKVNLKRKLWKLFSKNVLLFWLNLIATSARWMFYAYFLSMLINFLKKACKRRDKKSLKNIFFDPFFCLFCSNYGLTIQLEKAVLIIFIFALCNKIVFWAKKIYPLFISLLAPSENQASEKTPFQTKFEIAGQKYPNYAFLLPNLRIFISARNCAL